MRTDENERRTVNLGARFFESLGNIVGVVTLLDHSGMPPVGLEALGDIFCERQVGSAGERDQIVIVEVNHLAEMEMACERSRLLGNAFHQVAIAADDIGVVIDNVVAFAVIARGQPGFRNGHADAVAESLAERAGGDFDAHRMTALRMPRSFAAPLAEAFQFFERQIVAGEMEQAVEQHGAMTGRQDEAITVEPQWVLGIEFQVLRPERVGHRGRAHRHSRMTRVSLLHGIGREKADRIYAEIFKRLCFCSSHSFYSLPWTSQEVSS